jgi:hypothetical protein
MALLLALPSLWATCLGTTGTSPEILASPILSSKLVLGRTALVSCTERLTGSGTIVVTIARGSVMNDLFLSVGTSLDYFFLVGIRRFLWSIARHACFV